MKYSWIVLGLLASQWSYAEGTIPRRLLAVICGIQLGSQSVVGHTPRITNMGEYGDPDVPRPMIHRREMVPVYGDPSHRTIDCYKIYNDGLTQPLVTGRELFGSEAAAFRDAAAIENKLGAFKASHDRLREETAADIKNVSCACSYPFLNCQVVVDRVGKITYEHPAPLFGRGGLNMGSSNRCLLEARRLEGLLH